MTRWLRVYTPQGPLDGDHGRYYLATVYLVGPGPREEELLSVCLHQHATRIEAFDCGRAAADLLARSADIHRRMA